MKDLPTNAAEFAALTPADQEEFIDRFYQMRNNLLLAREGLEKFGWIRKTITALAILVLIVHGTMLILERIFPSQKQLPNVVLLQSQLDQVATAAETGAAKATLTTTLTHEQKADLVKAVKAAWTDEDIVREALVGYEAIKKVATAKEEIERQALIGYEAIVREHPPEDQGKLALAVAKATLGLIIEGVEVEGGTLFLSSTASNQVHLMLERKLDTAKTEGAPK